MNPPRFAYLNDDLPRPELVDRVMDLAAADHLETPMKVIPA